MKHIFMINRFSLRERLDKYVEAINRAAKKLKLDYKNHCFHHLYYLYFSHKI